MNLSKDIYIETSDQQQPQLQQSEDEKYVTDFQTNEFQYKNKLYELQSTIHNLSIEKQQNTLMFKRTIEQQKKKLQKANLINEQLTQQNKQLGNVLNKITQENELLKKIIENFNREQDHTLISNNKQRQAQNFYSPEILKQLESKKQLIRSQSKQIQLLKDQKNSSLKSQSFTQLVKYKQQQLKSVEKIKKELEEALHKIQLLKRNEVQLKKQYDSMLDSKEQIIKKLTLQNEDHSKNLLYSKQKMNSELKKQIQQLLEIINDNKEELKVMNDKNYTLEKQIGKLKRQSKKKDSEYIYQCEAEKQEIMKQYNERIKVYLKEKEDKIQTMQQERDHLQTEVTNLRAEELKCKTQISSMNQLIEYLQKVNKQHDSNKKKLQQTINQKDRQIGSIKQQSFKQVNELKKTISNLKKQSEEQIKSYEQELKQKSMHILKMQQKIRNLNYHDSRFSNSFSSQLHKTIDSYKFQNVQLKENINKWTKKYQEKCEQAQKIQTQLKKRYQDQLATLEMEMKEEKIKNIEMKAIQKTFDQQIRQQIDKIRLSKQLLEIEKEEKIQQNKKLKKKVQQLQTQIFNLQESCSKTMQQCHQKQQAYRSLKLDYDRLEDQARFTVKSLQKKYVEVSESLQLQQKKRDRRKSQSKDTEKKYISEIAKLKSINQQLKDELEQLKQYNKATQTQIEQKLKQLTYQLSIVRQRQLKAKNIQNIFKKNSKKQQKQIQKLNQLVIKLQEKLYSHQQKNKQKIDQNTYNAASSQAQELQNQNMKLRIQYSQTLKQLNILLQKYKHLEESHKQCPGREELMRLKIQKLQEKCKQVMMEKNQKAAELDKVQDQLSKVNMSRNSQQIKTTQRKMSRPIGLQSPKVQQFSLKKQPFVSPSCRTSNAAEKPKNNFQSYKKSKESGQSMI